VQFNDIWDLPWRDQLKEYETRAVLLWVSSALLHELDDMQFYHRNPRVSRKVREFAKWIRDHVKSRSDVENGILLEGRVMLRFLEVPLAADVSPDSQHLEAALALKDRGVRVTVVTNDTLLRVRALSEGLQVFDTPESFVDEKLFPAEENPQPK
jgi:predicted ribonuclease YlaK